MRKNAIKLPPFPGELHSVLKKETGGGKILWHYTNWSAFENILRTNEMWAFDYRFMNDYTELTHSLQFCRDQYREKLPMVHTFIEQALTDPLMLPIADVLSTSRQFDSLEQWRGYSRSSVGVALAFDSESLAHLTDKVGFRRIECAYSDVEKRERIKLHLDPQVEQLARSDAMANDPSLDEPTRHNAGKSVFWGHQWAAKEFMSQIALAFKDEAFHYEHEVRFVSQFRGGPNWVPTTRDSHQRPRRGFQARPGTLAPYSKIPLEADTVCEHPLIGVLVGPVSSPEAIGQRIVQGDMLEWIKAVAGNYSAQYEDLFITRSKVPLR